MNNISELKNIVIPKITSHEKLNKNYKVYPNIDIEKCVLCGKCVRICKESEHSALSQNSTQIVLNKEKCVGCSLCSFVCPKDAISMG